MKIILIAILFLASTNSFADKTLQCERYTLKGGTPTKQDRTIFTFSFSPENQTVKYKKISGPDWFLPSTATLTPVWKSKDNLRVVVYWLDKDYERLDTAWAPVYILDLDYKKPRYRVETYGGFGASDEVIYDPWKQDCQRTD